MLKRGDMNITWEKLIVWAIALILAIVLIAFVVIKFGHGGLIDTLLGAGKDTVNNGVTP